jgi:hypothetical protein
MDEGTATPLDDLEALFADEVDLGDGADTRQLDPVPAPKHW